MDICVFESNTCSNGQTINNKFGLKVTLSKVAIKMPGMLLGPIWGLFVRTPYLTLGPEQIWLSSLWYILHMSETLIWNIRLHEKTSLPSPMLTRAEVTRRLDVRFRIICQIKLISESFCMERSGRLMIWTLKPTNLSIICLDLMKKKETKKPSNMKKLKMLLCAKICLKRKYKKFWCVFNI